MSLDRRIVYTRKAIKKALYKLLNESSLEQITVKEICAEAEINRATFYRNYQDIFDLFESLEKELIFEAFPDGWTGTDKSQLIYVIYENQTFYKEFFRSHIESPYIKSVIAEGYEETLSFMKDNKEFSENNFHYSFQYMLHGILGVLREWLDNGCIEPPDEFTNIIFGMAEKQFK